MKIEAKVLILESRQAVWNVLMRSGSWRAWYGRELRRVDPRWQEAGLMVWAEGQPATIMDCAPAKRLEFGKCWFELSGVTDRTTMAVYGETLDSTLPDDERFAEQQRIEATALALKKYVESHGFRPFIRRLLGRQQSRPQGPSG